jgi:hypothetical protein
MTELTVNEWLGRIAVMCRTITQQGHYHVFYTYDAHIDSVSVQWLPSSTNYQEDSYAPARLVYLMQLSDGESAETLERVYSDLLALNGCGFEDDLADMYEEVAE